MALKFVHKIKETITFELALVLLGLLVGMAVPAWAFVKQFPMLLVALLLAVLIIVTTLNNHGLNEMANTALGMAIGAILANFALAISNPNIAPGIFKMLGVVILALIFAIIIDALIEKFFNLMGSSTRPPNYKRLIEEQNKAIH